MVILIFFIAAIACMVGSSNAKDSDNEDFLKWFAAVFFGASVLRLIF